MLYKIVTVSFTLAVVTNKKKPHTLNSQKLDNSIELYIIFSISYEHSHLVEYF